VKEIRLCIKKCDKINMEERKMRQIYFQDGRELEEEKWGR